MTPTKPPADHENTMWILMNLRMHAVWFNVSQQWKRFFKRICSDNVYIGKWKNEILAVPTLKLRCIYTIRWQFQSFHKQFCKNTRNKLACKANSLKYEYNDSFRVFQESRPKSHSLHGIQICCVALAFMSRTDSLKISLEWTWLNASFLAVGWIINFTLWLLL